MATTVHATFGDRHARAIGGGGARDQCDKEHREKRDNDTKEHTRRLNRFHVTFSRPK